MADTYIKEVIVVKSFLKLAVLTLMVFGIAFGGESCMNTATNTNRWFHATIKLV